MRARCSSSAPRRSAPRRSAPPAARRWLLLASIALAGCVPDLSPWQLGPADAGPRPPGLDAFVPPGVDAGPPAPSTGGPCGANTLLLAMRNTSGGPGRVLRWELRGVEAPRRCPDLAAEGGIDSQPFALAALDARFVLVGTRSGVVAIDAMTDRASWSLARSMLHPNDAFLLDADGSGTSVAVAWSNLGGSAALRGLIRQVEVFSREGDIAQTWTGTELGTGSSTAMTRSPRDGTEMLALNTNVFAAAEVDPSVPIRRDPPLVPPFADTALTSLAGGRSPSGTRRLAWTLVSGGEGAVALTNDPWGADPLDLQPVTCTGTPCTMIHAAIDPTIERGVVAICEREDRRHTVLRFDFDRLVCETWFDPDSAPTLVPTYLAVGRQVE